MKTIKHGIPEEPGTIWLMIRLEDAYFREEEDVEIINTIDEYLYENQMGVMDGESSGNGTMDATFETENTLKTANELDKYIKQHFPDLIYYISNKYEVMFEIDPDWDGGEE